MDRSFGEAEDAASFAAGYVDGRADTAYLRRAGSGFAVSDRMPALLPFVVAAPGDAARTILERLKRLAG